MSGEDPTDDRLDAIMQAALADVRKRATEARIKYDEQYERLYTIEHSFKANPHFIQLSYEEIFSNHFPNCRYSVRICRETLNLFRCHHLSNQRRCHHGKRTLKSPW